MRWIARVASRGSRARRRMPVAAYVVAAISATLVPVAAGTSAPAQVLVPPAGLVSFELRPGDRAAPVPSFSLTPAFAWRPVRGAAHYQFELSTNEGFQASNGVVWSSNTLSSPAAAVPISLPWLGRDRLYWRGCALRGEKGSRGGRGRGVPVAGRGGPARARRRPGGHTGGVGGG